MMGWMGAAMVGKHAEQSQEGLAACREMSDYFQS